MIPDTASELSKPLLTCWWSSYVNVRKYREIWECKCYIMQFKSCSCVPPLIILIPRNILYLKFVTIFFVIFIQSCYSINLAGLCCTFQHKKRNSDRYWTCTVILYCKWTKGPLVTHKPSSPQGQGLVCSKLSDHLWVRDNWIKGYDRPTYHIQLLCVNSPWRGLKYPLKEGITVY